MNCSKCTKKATIKTPFSEKNYCDKHFLDSIEKRIRKDLRINQKIDIKKQYYLDAKEPEKTVTLHFLNNIFEKRLQLTNKSTNIIIAKTLNSETDTFFESFLNNKELPEEKKINPLKNILEFELKEICRIINTPYKKNKENKMLSELESKYPGTRFSVLKMKEFVNKKKIN